MNSNKHILIYYFSGTGNSRNIATWVHNKAIEQGKSCDMHNIAHIDRLNIPIPPKDSLIVFISPIHGFNYPPVMVNFIRRFPKGKNKVVLMNSRAGMLIGKWITPGLSGIAFYLASIFLLIKGYSIQGMLPVDLPSNWMSLHPTLNKHTVDYLHEKNKERVETFFDKISSGAKYFHCLKEIIQDILISPISLGYYFVGRFMLAKTFYPSKACTNCKLCLKQCPVKAITIVDNKPYWKLTCESCMKCMSNCPTHAIETAHGFIIGWTFLVLALTKYLFTLSETYLIHIENTMLHLAIEIIIAIAFLSLSYRIMHYCLRFRTFERIITYTSFTTYTFWGKRYKALQYRVLKKSDYENIV